VIVHAQTTASDTAKFTSQQKLTTLLRCQAQTVGNVFITPASVFLHQMMI